VSNALTIFNVGKEIPSEPGLKGSIFWLRSRFYNDWSTGMKTPKPRRTVLDEWKEAKLEFVCPSEIQEKLVPAFAEFIRQTFRHHHLPKRWMKARQAAAYVGVHYQTFLNWCNDPETNVPKIPLPGKGHDFRFTKEMLDEWGRNRIDQRAGSTGETTAAF
jgi:hypothetical protein